MPDSRFVADPADILFDEPEEQPDEETEEAMLHGTSEDRAKLARTLLFENYP